MVLNDFAKRSKRFEKSIDSEYKKSNGIYYTDALLAHNILTFLNIPQQAKILDPCCGTGSFIIAARELGYNNIYGADFDNETCCFCRKNTGNNNIFNIDTISNPSDFVLQKLNLPNSVDYIIGNPPYVPLTNENDLITTDYLFRRSIKLSGNNLFVAALYRAFDLVKEDGVISYIIPKNFLHIASYSPLRKMILNEKTIKSIIDIGAYFKSVRGEQIIITLQNRTSVDNNINVYKLINDEFVKQLHIPQTFFHDEILLFSNEYDFAIFKKLETSYNKLGDLCSGYIGRGRSKEFDAVSGKDIKKFAFKYRELPKLGNQIFIQNIYSSESGIIACYAGSLKATETVTIFTDSDEKMCRYILGLLHSRLINFYLVKFCFNNSRLTMHTDAKYLKKLPLMIRKDTFLEIINIVAQLEIYNDYNSLEWNIYMKKLDDLIYITYNILPEEQEYINKQMNIIQSSKWNYDKRK